MSIKAALMLRGSGLMLAAIVVRVIVTFLLTPFILNALGLRWYGLWTVIAATIGHFSIIDLGLGTATKQYITLAIERGEKDRVSRLLTTSLSIYAGLGVLVFLVGLGVSAGAGFFFDDPEAQHLFSVCFAIAAANAAISLPGGALSGAIFAFLRGDLTAVLEIASNLLRALFVVLALSAGYGLIGVVAASLLTNIIIWGLHLLVLFRLGPWLRVRPSLFDRTLIRPLYGYGFWTFLITSASSLRTRIDSYILAGFRGLSAVSTYSFATTLIDYANEGAARTAYQFSTIFAQYFARNDVKNLREKFLIATRLTTLMACLMGGGLLIFGEQFLELWLGLEAGASYPPLAILSSAMIVCLIVVPGWELLFAAHRQQVFAGLVLGELVVKSALSFALVGPFGLAGVAIATIVPQMAIVFGYLSWAPCRVIGVPLKTYWWEIIRIALPALLCQIPIALFVHKVSFAGLTQLLAVAASTYIVLAIVLTFTVLRQLERQMAIGGVRRLLNVRSG